MCRNVSFAEDHPITSVPEKHLLDDQAFDVVGIEIFSFNESLHTLVFTFCHCNHENFLGSV